MKAVISNRIYLNECPAGCSLEKNLLSHLYFEINRMPQSPYPLIINNVQRVTDTVVSIPSGATYLIPDGTEIVDKRVCPTVDMPSIKDEYKSVFRPDQLDCIAYIDGWGLVEAKPGYGKTWVALGIAEKLKTKTLIVCTTTVIRDMWIKEVEQLFGFKPGVIGGGKFNIEPPIVVGNIQTVRNRLQEISKEFGLLVVDEVHRAPAATFTSVLNNSHARYKIGLSGTMERKDGLHVVLPGYFGTTKFVGKDENRMTPEVHLYKHPFELNANEFIPWSLKINQLMSDVSYKRFVLELAVKYSAEGHKVLVVADRTEFLEDLHLSIPNNSFIITGKITGETIRSDIMKAVAEYKEGCVLFGTQSIFAEGVSLNELSVLILATPISNDPLLEQLVGRVQRNAKNKDTCIVVDIELGGNTGSKQANVRKKFYIGKGWDIHAK